MVDPKDVTPGLWYVEDYRWDRPYTVVEVSLSGEVYMIGSDADREIYEPDLKFIAPVPPPPDGTGRSQAVR